MYIVLGRVSRLFPEIAHAQYESPTVAVVTGGKVTVGRETPRKQ